MVDFSKLAWSIAGLTTLVLGCGNLRAGPAESADAGPNGSPPVAATGGSVVGDQRLKLQQVGDVPQANYRAVYAVARDRVYVVGDESILEWDGHAWEKTTMGGVELSGVWGNATYALAVGTTKNTNRGVVMIRTPSRWVQFATVDHGLRAVWGTGDGANDRVVVVGNDGATYFGNAVKPMATGVQQDVPEDVPATMRQTLFYPVLGAVGGNSADHVVVAGPAATLFAYDGQSWKAEHQTVDLTRTFSAVWGPPGDAYDVIVGGNYYGLWTFHGGAKDPQTGERAMMAMLNEERDDVARGEQYVYGIWGESTSRFLAVGSSGRVMLFDGKEKPTIFATPAGAHDLRGISATAWDDLWLVGDDGTLLHGAMNFD